MVLTRDSLADRTALWVVAERQCGEAPVGVVRFETPSMCTSACVKQRSIAAKLTHLLRCGSESELHSVYIV